MAMTAQNASSVPQKLCPVTSRMIWARAASESLKCCQGFAPTATAATSTYSAVTHQCGDLHDDHDGVGTGGLAGPAQQEGHGEEDDDQCREVEDTAVAGRGGQ